MGVAQVTVRKKRGEKGFAFLKPKIAYLLWQDFCFDEIFCEIFEKLKYDGHLWCNLEDNIIKILLKSAIK